MQGAEQGHPKLTPPQRELEAALRELSPAACGIDRDRLLFEAGAAAGRSQRRYRKALTGALVILSGCFVLWWARSGAPEQVADRATAESGGRGEVKPGGRPGGIPARGKMARLDPLPLPVPGGPFVPVPSGFVSVALSEQSPSIGAGAYLTAIQGALERRLVKLPRPPTAPDAPPPVPATRDVAPGAPSAPAGATHPTS